MEGQQAVRLTANDQFKRGSTNWTQVGLLIAAGFHFSLFVLVRPFEAADLGVTVDELTAYELPPEVKIPPPPEQIARPATPRVARVDISEEITIAKSTFEANPSSELPPPPVAAAASDAPSFIPHDTKPTLRNGPEIVRLLERVYPRNLKDAQIEGEVLIWVYLNAQGIPENYEIIEGSGRQAFDDAAIEIAMQMRFNPAMNRDKPTDVWAAQRIVFQVR